MRKTICSGIITFGILVSLSSCYAFDYRSEEAGLVSIFQMITLLLSVKICLRQAAISLACMV